MWQSQNFSKKINNTQCLNPGVLPVIYSFIQSVIYLYKGNKFHLHRFTNIMILPALPTTLSFPFKLNSPLNKELNKSQKGHCSSGVQKGLLVIIKDYFLERLILYGHLNQYAISKKLKLHVSKEVPRDLQSLKVSPSCEFQQLEVSQVYWST